MLQTMMSRKVTMNPKPGQTMSQVSSSSIAYYDAASAIITACNFARNTVTLILPSE
jgi:hypothetical protein